MSQSPDLATAPEPSRSEDVAGYRRVHPAEVAHHVDRLMADAYQEPGLDVHPLDEASRWDFYEGHPTAQFRLHNLDFIRSLTETYRQTGDLAHARKADSIVHRWVAARGVPDETPAWHGHAVALRTSNLAHLVAAGYCVDGTLRDSLRVHADFLADEDNYEGAWNHGLDQNIALLQAGQALHDQSLAKRAAERLAQAAPNYVDEQGVVSEQATSYSLYMYQRLEVAATELRRAGLEVPPALRRADLIPTFLAWATRPDGVLVQVGDSKIEPVAVLAGTPLEFPATHGRSGTPPVGRTMFYDDGWGFIRSGWGERRPMADESHLTVRYGTFRRIHGHRDHTSVLWYTGGRPVLEDPGFTIYGDTAVRAYEQLEHSHSLLHLEGAGQYGWDKGTELLHHGSFKLDGELDAHVIHLGGYSYPDTPRTRSILHVPALDILLVRDAANCPRHVTAHQNWQFGASFADVELAADGRSARLSDGRGTVTLAQHLPVDAAAHRQGETEPLAGWVATRRGVRSPAPSLRFSRRGTQLSYVTSLTTRSDLSVTLANDGLVRVTLKDMGEEPIALVKFDEATGFQPTSLTPGRSTRWDHTEG